MTRTKKISNPAPKPAAYNIGDLIVIPKAHKRGLIISANAKKATFGYYWTYDIYWQHENGEITISNFSEGTIHNWLSKTEGMGKDNPNEYHPVVK